MLDSWTEQITKGLADVVAYTPRVWPNAAGRLIGLGCMRLSTERDRDEVRGIAVLHAALDAGVTFFDTADAYCWDESETGHNERLIARALAMWTGDRTQVVVATKGGLTRPDGRWAANGRAVHLRAACEASLRALDVSRIALYQLHAVDPRTPLATSVRALAALQHDRLVDRIGLCNVTVGQIEDARQIADITSVQVELSFWNDDNFLSGVTDYCAQHGIQLIAYRPLGGPTRARRAAKDRSLAEVAARHQATAQEIALAWLIDRSPAILPIPGPTRVETARSIARAQAIQLSDADRQIIERPRARGAPADGPHLQRDGELVLIMGLPGAGKTTLARTLVAEGFAHLSRDVEGGSLRGQLIGLNRLVAEGHTRIVLDNTYVSRKSRAAVVNWATAAGLPIRCRWLATTIEDAQVNAVHRMLTTYGRLLGPDEMKRAAKTDANVFPPGVQFRYQRELEPPDPSERFSRIDRVEFVRGRDPSYTNRAIVVWCDDLESIARLAATLRGYAASGWRVLGIAWRPDIASEQADAEFTRIREALGVPIDIQYCPHGAGPPVCWCRKPLPGLGVAFIRTYRLDPAQCIYVGRGPQDPGFARRLGFQFRDATKSLA
jgi:aryl-alcohol dehydrogenase-like predicted oxidoreductase